MTGPAGSSSTNRTWQSSHEQSREFHSEDWWTPLGGSHESTTLEGWSSGGEQSWSYSGPDGSWSIGGSWSDGSSPPAVEESWSWGTPPAGPLAAPEYAGPGDADYGDLISAIAVESLGAYNQPATRDAAVDAAIVAFVSLDADDQGQGGGAMFAEAREAGEEGGESDAGGGSPSPGGYPGGWWNPGNWWRGLYTGDPNAPDSYYEAAKQAAGESYTSNPARDGLRGLSYVDPTGLAEATDEVLTGLEEGEGFLTTAGNAGIAILPGPSPKKASKGARAVANAADEAGDAARTTSKGKRGKKAYDSGKAERHGDAGRKLSKSETQIRELEDKLKDATGTEAKRIKQKIKNIREAAERAKKGETHHRR